MRKLRYWLRSYGEWLSSSPNQKSVAFLHKDDISGAPKTGICLNACTMPA